MKKRKISIILPNYNSAEFIERTISSILSQTFFDWELILIDDGSDIKTKKILYKFKHIKKIKIIFLKKNKGAAYCRNLGIKKARAKYIAFIDADDFWKPNKLKNQYIFMLKNKLSFSYTKYYAFFKKKNKMVKVNSPKQFTFKNFIKNTSIGTSTMMVKKDLIKNIKFTNTKICEDYYFKCLILKKIKKAYCLDNFLTIYNIRKDSLQSNKLRNIFWIWKINFRYNRLSIFENLLSVFFISLNSLKKYGFK